MIKVSASWIASHVDGHWHNLGTAESLLLSGVTTDSRHVASGDIFIALKGDNFDGQQFITAAVEKGASAIICEDLTTTQVPVYQVNDSKLALGQLAAAVKSCVAPKSVAMTGSSGKTTVKEMCGAILRQCGSVWATPGNFNNDIGVPLSLLGLSEGDEYGVFELGANHQHEIAYTVGLVKPDCAMVLNVSEAHLEGFGSLDGVAQAKSEIYRDAPDDCCLIVNLDCQYAQQWLQQLTSLDRNNIRTVCSTGKADYFATDINIADDSCASFVLNTPQGSCPVKLTLPGEHNVDNTLAATASCMEVGASLENVVSGLASLTPVKGRLYRQTFGKVTVIDDSYNANVGSVKAAINLLGETAGATVLILGDMAELGEDVTQYHEVLGKHAQQTGIDFLLTTGQYSNHSSAAFGAGGTHCSDTDHVAVVANKIIAESENTITILVKGSRSAKMERVVTLLEKILMQPIDKNGDIS